MAVMALVAGVAAIGGSVLCCKVTCCDRTTTTVCIKFCHRKTLRHNVQPTVACPLARLFDRSL